MHIVFKTGAALIAAACIAGCSAQSQPEASQKQYLDMSEAEQTVALNNLVSLFTQAEKLAPQNPQVKTAHRADAAEDMIYSVGTYQKHVPENNLKQVKQTIAKLKSGMNICARPEIIALTEQGIGFQAIMEDLSGKRLFESEACRGAKAEVKRRGLSG